MVCVSRVCVGDSGGAAQQLRHADDAIHRRAQLMAHPRQEIALRLRRLRQLPVALDQLRRAQRHLRFQSLLGLDDAADLAAVRAHAMGGEQEHGKRVQRIRPRRAPGSGIAMNGQTQRRVAPDRIGIGRAHLEQVIARIQVGEGHAMLRAEIDPTIAEPRRPDRPTGCASGR